MTGGFAGSRSVDERRRRRLAAESENDAATSDRSRAGKTPAGSATVSPDVRPAIRTSDSFPLRKLLSRRVWKLWAVGVILLGVGAGILYGGRSVADSALFGPRVRELFDLAHGPAIRFFGCVLMLLAGQFALLIRWARSCSFTDFDGRYRGWSWVAAAWFCSSFAIAASAHNVWSETVVRLANLTDGHQSALTWLLPLSACAGWILWFLHGDMRGCKSSRALLWMAAIAVSAAGAQLVNGRTENSLLLSAAAMAGYLFLFMSMLLHARHVIYISAEPAKRTASPSRLRIRLPRFHRSRRPAGPVETTPPVDTAEVQAELSSASHDDSVADNPVGRSASEHCVPAQNVGTKREESTPPVDADPVVPASDTQDVRIDEPIDKDELKGLSKRERRKLRKQHRDQQRRKHGKNEMRTRSSASRG